MAMAMHCHQCPWLGNDIGDGFTHSQANPGHMTSTLDPTWAELEADRCEDMAAQYISKANELRRRAGLLVEAGA